MEIESLGKKEVAAMLKDAPPDLQEALLLRQQLAKSSVKKYQAMQNCVCKDGRAHGMFMFYGANRTGRFAGRLVQLQNLPQNHMSDLEEARSLVRCGAYDSMRSSSKLIRRYPLMQSVNKWAELRPGPRG